MTRICPSCNVSLPSQAEFCTQCGAPLPSVRAGTSFWLMVFLGLLVLALCALIGFGGAYLSERGRLSAPTLSVRATSTVLSQSPSPSLSARATSIVLSKSPSPSLPAPVFTASSAPVILPSDTPFPTPATPARAQVSNQIYFAALRQSPGYRGKNDQTDVLAKVPAGETVQILLAEPQSADGLTWWYVSWSGVKGWMADHTGSGKTILLFLP